MPRSTEDVLLWARSNKRVAAVYVVRWTGAKPPYCGRIVSTADKADDVLRAWKAWKLRRGWKVQGSMSGGFLAVSPEGEHHACALRCYDRDTLAELT